MSEFRQDPVTGEWVLIAGERGRRPQDVRSERSTEPVPAYRENCPFCPGNEAMTPPTEFSLPNQAVSGRWRLRAFANKYPALTSFPPPVTPEDYAFFVARAGDGAHEVLVETPVHNHQLTDRSTGEMTQLMQAYQVRFRTLQTRFPSSYILIHKNAGAAAGTSLEHPHSQIVAMPFVPARVQAQINRSREYHNKTGCCLLCAVAEGEQRDGRRMVLATASFLVFHPFAAAFAAETWIVPRKHQASFDAVAKPARRDCGLVLRTAVRALREGFGNPPYNYVIQSFPDGTAGAANDAMHWYLRLMPRTAIPAGFELGTGTAINPAWPEETAATMRRALVPDQFQTSTNADGNASR